MTAQKLKYHIITLGCPKNAVDSEGMHGILAAEGHSIADTPDVADVIVVNTCSFIAAARDETLAVLGDLAHTKQPGQRLVAAGCMAESHGDLLRRRVPGLDAIVSTKEWMRIGHVVGELMPQGKELIPLAVAQPIALSQQPPPSPTRAAGTPATFDLELVAQAAGEQTGYADWRTQAISRHAAGPSAYLKISDGCNLRCSFCTIPSFKGDMRSKPVGAILGEAQQLARQGVREIVLVAQHLTDYGRDLGLKDGLATLLDELGQLLPKNVWLRLMYAYPTGVSERLIESMARNAQVCKYLDMPLQHAHPSTLRRMRRPPDAERTLATIRALREAMPDLALRSTFIVGFPGETRQEFEALLEFLQEVQFDRAGAFRFSKEPGTHAATLAGQVPQPAIDKRWHRFMALQQEISRVRNRRWLGRTIDVLVEGQGTADDGRMLSVGRSFRDAPEVDGQVFVWGSLPVGSIATVRVTQALEYDLWGEPAGPPTS
jgi:ribosomal protein S12 methylthiotransferase